MKMIVESLRCADARENRIAACTVTLENLEIDALIGVLGHEHGQLQRLVVSVEAEIAPPAADRLDETLDYCLIADAARRLAGSHVGLIETFACRLGTACLDQPGVAAVKVTVRKPGALPGALAGTTIRLRKEHNVKNVLEIRS